MVVSEIRDLTGVLFWGESYYLGDYIQGPLLSATSTWRSPPANEKVVGFISQIEPKSPVKLIRGLDTEMDRHHLPAAS